MAPRSLRIVNESRRKSAADYERVDAIAAAVQLQLRDLAGAWGQYVWQVVDDANRTGFKIALLEDSDDASALGYHDVDERDGSPYARVFLAPILDDGGHWLLGADSVAATVSHEVCEMVGDPTANHWAQTRRGALVAQELCDPVESLAYRIDLRDGRRVSVSDFVFPDWFNPFAAPGARLDHMHVLERPFEIADDGYVIRKTPSGIRNAYGKRYPHWRQATKRSPGSRTFARHRAG
jgi:hypothetical protein